MFFRNIVPSRTCTKQWRSLRELLNGAIALVLNDAYVNTLCSQNGGEFCHFFTLNSEKYLHTFLLSPLRMKNFLWERHSISSWLWNVKTREPNCVLSKQSFLFTLSSSILRFGIFLHLRICLLVEYVRTLCIHLTYLRQTSVSKVIVRRSGRLGPWARGPCAAREPFPPPAWCLFLWEWTGHGPRALPRS